MNRIDNRVSRKVVVYIRDLKILIAQDVFWTSWLATSIKVVVYVGDLKDLQHEIL